MTFILPHLRSQAEKDALLFGKKLGKFVTTGELPKPKAKRQYKEASEQSAIATWLKKYHPNIPFETVKHEGKKAKWEQQQHAKQNTEDSFPDTRIYLDDVTLMIENKKLGERLTDKEGRLASMHLQYQYNTHKRLFKAHTKVYFAVGVDEAIRLIERAIDGSYSPMQVFKNHPEYDARLRMEDEMFLPNHLF